MSPGRVIYIIVVATTLAVAVVWQRGQQRDLGYRLEKLNSEVADQEEQRDTYRVHVSKLKSPQRILNIVKQYGLHLRASPTVPSVGTSDGPAKLGVQPVAQTTPAPHDDGGKPEPDDPGD